MANTLTQLEAWRVESPLYCDWSDFRLTAYYDTNSGLFTIGRFTLNRRDFIKRYGEPGEGADVICWQPPEKGYKMSKNVTKYVTSDPSRRDDHSRAGRRKEGRMRITERL